MKKKIVAVMLSMALVFGMTTSTYANENPLSYLGYNYAVNEIQMYLDGYVAGSNGLLKSGTVGGDWFDENTCNIAISMTTWDGTVYLINQVYVNGVESDTYYVNNIPCTEDAYYAYFANAKAAYNALMR